MGGIIMDKEFVIFMGFFFGILAILIICVTINCTMVDAAAAKAGLHQDVVQGRVVWVK